MRKEIIEQVANEIVRSVGGKTTRGDKSDMNTLYNFGSLGLQTPLGLATAFYNSFEKARKLSINPEYKICKKHKVMYLRKCHSCSVEESADSGRLGLVKHNGKLIPKRICVCGHFELDHTKEGCPGCLCKGFKERARAGTCIRSSEFTVQ